MDQEKTNQPDNDLIDTETSMVEGSGATEEVIEAQQVVLQRKGGGLALLFSIIALLAVAYLYYLYWQQDQAVANTSQSAENEKIIQQLQDRDMVLGTDLSNALVDIKNLNQRLDDGLQQIEQKLNQPSTQSASDAFDNSTNEQALEQLQQQLATQAQLINSLELALTANRSQPNSMQANNSDRLHRQTAIHMLMTAQMMVDTGQLQSAINTMDRFNLSSPVDENFKRQINQLADQLKQLDQPNLMAIKSDLVLAEKGVAEMVLIESKVVPDDTWYDSLISIKKIDPQSNINNSVQLDALKMELQHLLYAAQLHLTLKQQTEWQHSLATAKTKLQQQRPKQEALIQLLQKLSVTPIQVNIPASFDTKTVINALQGS